MTRYFPFVPNVQGPFKFQPTLDGQTYAASVVWNLAGQRWYLSIRELTGTPVLLRALVGSPDGASLEAVSWSFGDVTAVLEVPHGYTVGQTVRVTVSGCLPEVYNGVVQAFVIDDRTVTYPLASDPGDATRLGAVIYNVNLVENYFDVSTLVYRGSNSVFEVSP